MIEKKKPNEWKKIIIAVAEAPGYHLQPNKATIGFAASAGDTWMRRNCCGLFRMMLKW